MSFWESHQKWLVPSELIPLLSARPGLGQLGAWMGWCAPSEERDTSFPTPINVKHRRMGGMRGSLWWFLDAAGPHPGFHHGVLKLARPGRGPCRAGARRAQRARSFSPSPASFPLEEIKLPVATLTSPKVMRGRRMSPDHCLAWGWIDLAAFYFFHPIHRSAASANVKVNLYF